MPAKAIKRRLRHAIHALRRPWVSKDSLVRDLRALGIREGGVLMVHSSLSRLGFVPGGATSVVSALLELVGPAGTLVLPTHTWNQPGRGNFTFDVRSSPSCVGEISETLRVWPGAIRSLHPTHSVAAIGPLAEKLTSNHDLADRPCGIGTPYLKLVDFGADVLFLGVDLDSNTLFHTFEALAELPYLMRPSAEEFLITNYSGIAEGRSFCRHEQGPKRRFAETTEMIRAFGALRDGKAGASTSFLVDARGMSDCVMQHLAADPEYLLAK